MDIVKKLTAIDEARRPSYFELTPNEFYEYFNELSDPIKKRVVVHGFYRAKGGIIVRGSRGKRCLAFRGRPVFVKCKK